MMMIHWDWVLTAAVSAIFGVEMTHHVTRRRLLAMGRVLRPLEVAPFDKGTIAQMTGATSRIIVLDFDEADEIPLVGLRPHRKTPNGYHVDVTYEEGAMFPAIPGMDVLSDGRCAVVLGGKNGVSYTWLRDPEPYSLAQVLDALRQKAGADA